MLDHVPLGTHRLDRGQRLLRAPARPARLSRAPTDAEETAFGPGDDWSFFLCPADASEPTTGARLHVAFRAPDRTTAIAG